MSGPNIKIIETETQEIDIEGGDEHGTPQGIPIGRGPGHGTPQTDNDPGHGTPQGS
jgi:hypothetical protein